MNHQPRRFDGRREDLNLITGQARFTDDVRCPGEVHAVFVRAVHAHAEILAVDTSAARGMPGVLGVFTGADLAADGVNDIPPLVSLPGRDGKPMFAAPMPVLARDRVRHVGDAVAIVVADSLMRAQDAAEGVAVHYRELPAASEIGLARAADAPALWPGAPGNVALDWTHGDAAAVDEAFATAAHRVTMDLRMTRLAPTALEPRAAIGMWDEAEQTYTLIASTQGVSVVRKLLAEAVFKVPPERIRIRTFDVGGGFGMKVQAYPEYAAVLYAARKLGRPVRWCATRLESFMADTHGRDGLLAGELALDGDGRFLALRARTQVGMGAYISTYAVIVATNNTKNCLSSVYRIPAIHIDAEMVLTNASPLGPYRGAGRPEAIYLVERLIDEAARVTGIDRVELRRRNMIPAEAMPYRAPSGQAYDSGEFEVVLQKALDLADWDGFERRRAESRAKGLLRGIGLCSFLEVAGGSPLSEVADLRFGADGSIELRTGSQAMGQGQLTTLPLILARQLAIDPQQVKILQGDSSIVHDGIATVASRSTMMVGGAIVQAVDQALEKGRKLAADLLEVSPGDIDYEAGRFRIAGTDRSVTLAELAARSQELDTVATFTSPEMSFPNGCHICEVEIDPGTGEVRVVKYTGVDDIGEVIHPVIVEGQIHGGVAQALGQVLGESVVYSEHGQMLTSSFMDYAMPRADTVPAIQAVHHVVPCTTNPLGVKGAGESGVSGALPAAANAIIHALSERGITRLDMPMSPAAVWEALQTAR
jgi:carbon-monoxide dehydrogenase large subunit